MKKNLSLLFAATALVSAACSDEEGTPPADRPYTITFERAELGPEGYLWGKSLATEEDEYGGLGFQGAIYSEDVASLATFYSDFGGMWESWSRFAIGGNHDKQTAGTGNQFSVYTTADDGDNQFAVGYYMAGMGPGYTMNPLVEFDVPVRPVSCRMAHAVWTYLHLKGDYSDFAVRAIGFNGGQETASTDVALASDGQLTADWTEVDLSPLGEVTQIVFTTVCDDDMVPAYFCLDDLTYRR